MRHIMDPEELLMQEKTEYSLKQLLLYKIDRALTVIGLAAIGVAAIWKGELNQDIAIVVVAVVNALGITLAVRQTGKNK